MIVRKLLDTVFNAEQVMWGMQCGVRYSGVSDCAVTLQNEAIQKIRSALIIIKQKCSFVSAGWNRRIFSSISASFRFTRQNVYCIGRPKQ